MNDSRKTLTIITNLITQKKSPDEITNFVIEYADDKHAKINYLDFYDIMVGLSSLKMENHLNMMAKERKEEISQEQLTFIFDFFFANFYKEFISTRIPETLNIKNINKVEGYEDLKKIKEYGDALAKELDELCDNNNENELEEDDFMVSYIDTITKMMFFYAIAYPYHQVIKFLANEIVDVTKGYEKKDFNYYMSNKESLNMVNPIDVNYLPALIRFGDIVQTVLDKNIDNIAEEFVKAILTEGE